MKKKFKIAEIIDFFNQNSTDITFYILVINTDLKPYDVTKLKNQLGRYDFQIFNVKELQFNPSHHELVPEHEIINPEDHDIIQDYYGLQSLDQLPIILSNDPMAKYLGMKQGQVVRITRTNPHSGVSTYFRWCQD